jgi:hypothetical protein
MEGVLWYVLTGTRGGTNRVRILRAIDERPRNANQLAEDLELNTAFAGGYIMPEGKAAEQPFDLTVVRDSSH